MLSVCPASLQAPAMSCELSPEPGIRENAMTKITLLGKLNLQPYQCMWDGGRPVEQVSLECRVARYDSDTDVDSE